MATKDYNFQYTPLTGRLPGNSFVKQTEQAINELAGIVNEGSAQVEVLTNLANQANDNSEVALEKATEALETSSRVYITLPNLDDADDYYDSQLYYFANSHSANLPVEDTGFLEVKTNDTKTAAEQVFIADTTGLMYMRHGVITSEEVGDETVYSVTWDIWSSALASEDYVQQEVNTGIGAANDYTDEQISDEITRADGKYLPLSGGTMTGAININGNAINMGANSSSDGRVYTISNYLRLTGGNSTSNGSWIDVGSSSSSNKGITINASDGNGTTKELKALYDGTLTWDGNDITPQQRTYEESEDVTLANNTAKTIMSFSLTKGTWLVVAGGYFGNNATGIRDLLFSATNNGGAIDRTSHTRIQAPNGEACFAQVMYIFSVASTTTYYLVGRQTSGGDLIASGGIIKFRLSSKV